MEATKETNNGVEHAKQEHELQDREISETRAKLGHQDPRDSYETREIRDPKEYQEPREYSVHRELREVRELDPHEYRSSREYSTLSRGEYHSRRSRSRSPHRGYNHERPRRHYRSRSRSAERGYLRTRRERPQRDFYARENPKPSDVLGVFGLSASTRERDLDILFSKYGKVEQVKIIYDRASGTSRGFGFINFASVEDASTAKEKLDGMFVHERCIRVDFSITHRAHSPTPGEYMGEPRRASHSIYRHQRKHRSRSRSPDYERRRSYYRSPPHV